jgi:2-C-methyl-D-erythritol 2,4-cyclodiphosphate synthase
MSARSGIGYDSHRLVGGRPLILGGVELDAERGLAGHSDADALTHAVIDALLGGAGLGDIGVHFPDSDERYRDADSLVLLAQAAALVRAAGFEIVNVDATIVMERPKLGDARAEMCERLALALGVARDDVNVKASTGEGIGFVGREEGVAAIAIASLRRAPRPDDDG